VANLNSNLHSAKNAKKDEFYTQYEDIEKELVNYRDQFKDKVVYCNCDDPKWSNFTKFFLNNFKFFELKKLICTHFELDKPSYKLVAIRNENGDGIVDENDMLQTPLKQNKQQQMSLFDLEDNAQNFSGDFRSPECIELLKESDIVVTNPPFSLFREYIAQLIEYNKKFVILGEQNAIETKELFEYVRQNKLWLGYDNGGTKWFQVPNSYDIPTETRKKIVNGIKYFSMGRILWYTNLDTKKRKEMLPMLSKVQNERKGIIYEKYNNYNALNVDFVSNIPFDYEGIMGVPVTFLSKWNPEQFEIIGHTHSGDISNEVEKIRTDKKNRHRGFINGKQIYSRILIKHKLQYDEYGNLKGAENGN
jgi:hypothetical protein